jgi:hypothetical protein
MEVPVKPKTVEDKDWQKVEEYVKQELSRRESDSFRKTHEAIWKEVDRQVYMKSPERKRKDPNQKGNSWHSAIELGELAKASEMITADVMRLIFPTSRAWFEAHVELPAMLNEQTGESLVDQKQQVFDDGRVRAFMAQQHQDFGFKSRIALSVKEALHHGGFVAEARQEDALLVHDGSGLQSLSAPVWVPHSMWNCYPDPSPSVLGTNLLYTGSMIIKEYMPRWKLREVANKGAEIGWMPANLEKVKKRRNKNKDVETEDVELVKYIGDLVINQTDGDLFLPNSKVILANGTIIFYAPNKLPFPNIIYGGYEKLDVRDPYFISPIIKLSPMHKAATVLLNKYLDGVSLQTEKPLLYDGNDPDFIKSGGPVIAPGWKGPTKGKAAWQTIDVGDPTWALNGLQTVLNQIKEGTANDANRATPGDQTATASRLAAMRGEVRVVDFVDKLEFNLKTFLYLQHEINKQELQMYSFYNPEMDAPDFMRMTLNELPVNIHFDVVGSKGVLGEEERAQKMSVVTAFAAQHPLFQTLIKPLDILKEMYQDAGVKNPERFLNIPTEETIAEVEMVQKEAQAALQEKDAEIFELQKELAIAKAVNGARIVEAQAKSEITAETTAAKAASEINTAAVKTGLDVAAALAKDQEKKDQ